MRHLWARLRCWLWGHQHLMEFPDPNTLGWEFRCFRCGHTTPHIFEATP